MTYEHKTLVKKMEALEAKLKRHIQHSNYPAFFKTLNKEWPPIQAAIEDWAAKQKAKL